MQTFLLNFSQFMKIFSSSWRMVRVICHMYSMCLSGTEKVRPKADFWYYSTGVQTKSRISPVFSFLTTLQLATLIRDWNWSFLGPDLE